MKLSKKLRNSPLIFKGIIKTVTPSKSVSTHLDKSPPQQGKDESFPNIYVDTRQDDDDDICSIATEKCEDVESPKSSILPDRSFILPEEEEELVEEARDEMQEEIRDDAAEIVGDCKERENAEENVDGLEEVVWSWTDIDPNAKAEEAGPDAEQVEKVELTPPIGCRPSCGEFNTHLMNGRSYHEVNLILIFLVQQFSLRV